MYTPITMSYPGLKPIHSEYPTIIGKGVATIGVIPNQLFFFGWTMEQTIAVNVKNKGIILIRMWTSNFTKNIRESRTVI